jgi:surface antigen
MKFASVVPLAALLLLTACAGGGSGSSGNAPAVSTIAVIKSMDDADQAYMTDHFNHAMESAVTGQSVNWTNPSSGYQVQVSPTRTFQQANSTYCREFTQSVIAKSDPSTTHGTACRQPDGSWQIVG